jgi:hypothetical protein
MSDVPILRAALKRSAGDVEVAIWCAECLRHLAGDANSSPDSLTGLTPLLESAMNRHPRNTELANAYEGFKRILRMRLDVIYAAIQKAAGPTPPMIMNGSGR